MGEHYAVKYRTRLRLPKQPPLRDSWDTYIKDVKDMLIRPAYLGSMGEGELHVGQRIPSLRNWGMEFPCGLAR